MEGLEGGGDGKFGRFEGRDRRRRRRKSGIKGGHQRSFLGGARIVRKGAAKAAEITGLSTKRLRREAPPCLEGVKEAATWRIS